MSLVGNQEVKCVTRRELKIKCAIRPQVIYPQTREEMIRRGRTDEELARFLEIVQLSYLTNREDGWDAVEDWMDVLSGGEKQRIAVSILILRAN